MLSQGTRHIVRSLFNYPEAHTQLRPTAWLDGLRGVAAFEVLLYHYHLQFLFYEHNPAYGSRPDTYQWWRLPYIRNFYHSGHAMVNVFFLISGFVLTQRSLTLIRTQNYEKLYPAISSAIFRRALRIYLPAAAVTFVGMLLTWVGIQTASPARIDNLFLQILDWLYACRDFAQPFHNYHNQWELYHKYEAVMWTLPLEFYGSVVCYLTLLAVARITHSWKRTAVILTVTYFAAVKANWWCVNFLIGMLHADFMIWQGKTEGSWSTSFQAKCIYGVVFVWALYVAGLPDAHYDDYNLPGYDWYYKHFPESWREAEDGGRFWWMISGCTMTFCISQLPVLKKIFETRFCQYLGRISFMLYLVHMYVFNSIGKRWKEMLTGLVAEDVLIEATQKTVKTVPGNNGLFVYFAFWILMLPLVMVIAGQVTKHVDDPSIRFAKWLENKAIANEKHEYTTIIPMQ
jgi:peptidoglycan/LPS O-acetylase OafA/YrhL